MATRPTTLNAFTGEDIPAYLQKGVNRFTGNLNDPFEQAQHNFAGPGPAALAAALRKQGLSFASLGRGGPLASVPGGRPSLGSGRQVSEPEPEPMEQAPSLAAWSGSNVPLDMVEQELRDLRDRQDVRRAAAIANQPDVSPNGRDIVGEKGRYETAAPTGAPANRQAIAAQMAPGLIAPPPPDKPVTFGNPEPAMIDGKRVFVRPGSDGRMYDMARRPVDPASLQPAGSESEPLVSVMGPDGRPILVKRSQAEGKTPASSREQGRPVTSGDAGDLADFDTSKDELAAVRAAISPEDSTGIVAQVGAKIPYVTQITGWGTDAKKRQAVIDRVKQVIGKTLEGGVLRKEDEAKYEKILPTIGDAPDVAKAKLDGLDAAIDKRKQRRLDALNDAGYETGRFSERGGGGMVTLQAPDGSTRQVPAAQADHYIGLGAKRVGR